MADFSPAPVAGLFLRSRNQPCGWALGWWVCRLTGRPCWLHLKDLNLAPLAPLRCGAFVWHPPARAVQPTLQLGVGGGGLPLMIWPLGGKLHQTVWTNLAPSPWRGFCLATPPRSSRAREPAPLCATHPHSHFVFPDCKVSPRCAADLVFYRCMRMNPLAPPPAGPFLCAVCCMQPVPRPPR
jgi:hypothetical protein